MSTKFKDTLVPLEHQVNHLKKIQKCLKTNWFAFDFSALGSGKTFCGALLSKDFNYILVVAPTSVGIKWKQIKENYTIFDNKEIDIISYAKLRQKNTSKWLNYSYAENTFTLTDSFKEILKTKRVLLVCRIDFDDDYFEDCGENINGEMYYNPEEYYAIWSRVMLQFIIAKIADKAGL